MEYEREPILNRSPVLKLLKPKFLYFVLLCFKSHGEISFRNSYLGRICEF
ncbi:hypothetical protein IC582_012734 [Cucumis melo]